MTVYDAINARWLATLTLNRGPMDWGTSPEVEGMTRDLGTVLSESSIYALEAEPMALIEFATVTYPGGPFATTEAPEPTGFLYLPNPMLVVTGPEMTDTTPVDYTIEAVGWRITPGVGVFFAGFERRPGTTAGYYMVVWRLQEGRTGVPGGFLNWMRTFWAFVQQKVVTVEPAHVNRAVRRQAEREGKPVDGLRVVTLRRAQPHRPVTPGEAVEWSHRWMVTGHWRRQPYRSRGEVRDIFIWPYVKGPEDKPLVAKVTVFDVAR